MKSAALTPTIHPPVYKVVVYRARISSPERKEKIGKLQRAIEVVCPIYNMIKDGRSIRSSIVGRRLAAAPDVPGERARLVIGDGQPGGFQGQLDLAVMIGVVED